MKIILLSGCGVLIAALLAGCGAGVSPEALDATEAGAELRRMLNSPIEDVPESGALQGGSAVYFLNQDAAFWKKGGVFYAVNDRAKALLPNLESAPPSITYQAVYEATLPFPGYAAARAGELVASGRRFSEDAVKKLEANIEKHPGDLWARTVLIGYYSSRQGLKNTGTALKDHALWVIRNAPESACAAIPRLASFLSDNGLYEEASAIWKEQIEKAPENTKILSNAAAFFASKSEALAQQCIEKCAALEPGNRVWADRLAMMRSVSKTIADIYKTPSSPPQNDAKQDGGPTR